MLVLDCEMAEEKIDNRLPEVTEVFARLRDEILFEELLNGSFPLNR
jgi:hypothetical protein